MKYDVLRNHVGGTLVDGELPLLDVYDPSHGTVIGIGTHASPTP